MVCVCVCGGDGWWIGMLKCFHKGTHKVAMILDADGQNKFVRTLVWCVTKMNPRKLKIMKWWHGNNDLNSSAEPCATRNTPSLPPLCSNWNTVCTKSHSLFSTRLCCIQNIGAMTMTKYNDDESTPSPPPYSKYVIHPTACSEQLKLCRSQNTISECPQSIIKWLLMPLTLHTLAISLIDDGVWNVLDYYGDKHHQNTPGGKAMVFSIPHTQF